MFYRAVVASAVFLLAGSVLAGDAVLQLSLLPDIALHDRDDTVKGISIGVWSENRQSALTLGLVSGAPGRSSGIMFSFLANYSQDYTGIQLAPINVSTKSHAGIQWGTINYAGKLSGIQLGLLNFAERADSALQIGAINIIGSTDGWFDDFPSEIAPVMVLANWRFSF